MAEAEKYLHGFTSEEQDRLYEQAQFLEQITYNGIDLSDVKHLLEVGSGVGGQSEILLRRFPHVNLTGIDLSEAQVNTARARMEKNPLAKGRVTLRQMDATDMNFLPGETFDGAFLCWVLEHVPQPQRVLSEVRRVLQPGSVVYVTEVLNPTLFFEPPCPHTLQYWTIYNSLQQEMGGDPVIGAKLGNLLLSLGYHDIRTEVKTFFLDNRDPAKREEMVAYWIGLMMSGLPNLLKAGYVTEETAAKVKEEMHNVAKDPNAVFFYSFVQARART